MQWFTTNNIGIAENQKKDAVSEYLPQVNGSFGFDYNTTFKQNIEQGIQQGLYRKDILIDTYVNFYYILIFCINGIISSEIESKEIELQALEYHTRAMATPEGIIELEKQLHNYHL